MPLFFLHYSGDILPKKVTPFYSLQAGYSLIIQPNRAGNIYYYSGFIHTQGGIFGGLVLGCRLYASRKRVNIGFGINFDVQQTRYWLKPDAYTYAYYRTRLSGYQILYMPGTSVTIGF